MQANLPIGGLNKGGNWGPRRPQKKLCRRRVERPDHAAKCDRWRSGCLLSVNRTTRRFITGDGDGRKLTFHDEGKQQRAWAKRDPAGKKKLLTRRIDPYSSKTTEKRVRALRPAGVRVVEVGPTTAMAVPVSALPSFTGQLPRFFLLSIGWTVEKKKKGV